MSEDLFAEIDGIYQIPEGAEEIKAMFFDEDALIVQPQPVYRINVAGNRYYYTFDKEGNPTFYQSVTSMIKNTLPTPVQLIKWMADLGYDESRVIALEKASYGTFLHALCQQLTIDGKFNMDDLFDKLKAFTESEHITDCIDIEEIKKDLLAYAQFLIDYKVKPLAIEIVLTHPEDGYAGALDLVAEFEIEEKGFFGEVYKSGERKGEPKESKESRVIRGIIDIKSGKKGFYESHEIQLEAYRQMWNIQFPEKPVEKIYNWSPKEWRDNPTYNFKDQSGSKNLKKLPYLVELSKIEHSKRTNSFTILGGEISLEEGLDKNITEVSMYEYVRNKSEEEEPLNQ